MSVSISKSNFYAGTGEVSYRSLRDNFKEILSGDCKASELLRDVVSEVPIVPDAIENQNISVSEDLKSSQFRGSTKYYTITVSGSSENIDIESLDWNGNLEKSIEKRLIIEGTVGSNDATIPAATFNNTNAKNLLIDVFGNIYGAAGRGGGTGGGAPDPTGQKGGDALSITSSADNNVVVYVRTGGKIYGGGGGGERGRTGSNGNGGRCCSNSETRGCGGAPGCGNQVGYSGNCGGCCSYRGCGWGGRCCNTNWHCRYCQNCNDTSGGNGGVGGTGGLGRGYNNLTGALGGSIGANGNGGGGCGANSGQRGETGGSGGEWANDGGNTNNGGTGGSAGSAIIGSGYSVDGVINGDTIKGSF